MYTYMHAPLCIYIYTYTRHQKHEDHSACKHPAAKELSFALVKKDLWIINILRGQWSKLMVNPKAAFISNNLLYYQPNVCLFSYYGNENCEIMCWPQFCMDPYQFALASGLLSFSKALSFVITYLNKVCLLTKEGYIGEEYIRFNSIYMNSNMHCTPCQLSLMVYIVCSNICTVYMWNLSKTHNMHYPHKLHLSMKATIFNNLYTSWL